MATELMERQDDAARIEEEAAMLEADAEPCEDQECGDDSQADQEPTAEECHEAKIMELSTKIGEVCVKMAKIEAERKRLKDAYKVLVESLSDTVERGPEEMPLFDQPAASSADTDDAWRALPIDVLKLASWRMPRLPLSETSGPSRFAMVNRPRGRFSFQTAATTGSPRLEVLWTWPISSDGARGGKHELPTMRTVLPEAHCGKQCLELRAAYCEKQSREKGI